MSHIRDSAVIQNKGMKNGRQSLEALLISLVITALLMGLITLITLVVRIGKWQYLPLLSFGVALEAVITTRWLNRFGRRINRVAYRAAELTIIFLIARIITWTIAGQAPNLEKLQDILVSPASILDVAFVVYASIAFLSWERGTKYGDIFDRLAIDEKEIDLNIYHRSDGYGMDSLVTVDRNKLLGDFLRSWMIGGLILAFLAMLTTVKLVDLNGIGELVGIRTIARLGLRSDMLLALLVYLFGGLWLASSGRLSTLRSRWLMDGISVDREIRVTWITMTVVLLGIFAFVAAFLPIGSTIAISRILHAIVGLTILALGAVLAIAGWIYFMVANLFLGKTAVDESFEFDQIDLIPPPPPSPPAPANEFVTTISGILFWVLILGIATAAVVFFLRVRGVKFRLSWLGQIWDKINGAFSELWLGAMRPIFTVAVTIGHQLRRPAPPNQKAVTPWRFTSLRRLSSRAQIRYFYLSTVRRAGQRGVKRERSKTPLEYAADLRAGWPEVEEAVDDLTEAFQKVRYSRKSIRDSELGQIKKTWKLVRSAVKKRRNKSQ